MAAILLILFSVILFMLVVVTYRLHGLPIKHSDEAIAKEKAGWLQGWIYGAIVLCLIAIIASIYFLLKGSSLEGHMLEWLNIVVRVMHVTFGIAWIGASFYFVFLENALNRTEGNREELAGHLWAVHGGGFYYLEKYKTAPKVIPRHLHWFKYEAYFTWLSGIALLSIIYYFNSTSLMIDVNVMRLSALQAIGISTGSLIVAWIIYDLLCKSSLIKKQVWFTVSLILLFTGFAWFYSQVFSGRAAYIHFGAMLGTLMAANVFFVIIPAQKAMVNAARAGLPADAIKGKNALFRSIHNNYLTLPVLFVMVSNHFPGTFSNKYQWVVLAVISLGTVGIKHWLNLREQGRISVWVLPAAILLLLVAAFITVPERATGKCDPVPFARVHDIIQTRCVSCHSSKPTDPVYPAAPNGVAYDTPLDIIAKKELILQRVVHTKTMPLNNKTNMTPEERDLVRCWIEQGAKAD